MVLSPIRLYPLFSALCVLLLIYLSGYIIHHNEAEMDLHEHRENTQQRLNDVAASISSGMYVRLNLTSSLSAFVTTRREFTPEEFDDFAGILQKGLSGVMSLQLAPDGIVTYITNIERNKKALGHDLMKDPDRRKMAEKSIRERSYIIAGPINLIQGGQAIIARWPIFLSIVDGDEEHFWGFATILIDLNFILSNESIVRLGDEFSLAVRGKHGLGEKGEVFIGDKSTFDTALAKAVVQLPNASWVMAVAEKHPNKFPGFIRSPWYWGMIVLLSFISAIAVYINVDRPRRLKIAINRATNDLNIEVEHRKSIEDEFRYMAQHDKLTGLPNRRLFDELSAHVLAKVRRDKTQCGILFIDIDEFKEANDSFGHQAGDQLLKMIANRFTERLRKADVIARYGGDEFVVIITEKNLVDSIQLIAKDIVTLISNPYKVGDDTITVGASIGISIYPDHGSTIDGLIEKADAAMYMAKKNGKNAYKFANP